MTVAARPQPGARVVRIEAGSPLVVTRPTGFGMVLWVGFDPFRVPPESVTSRRALWAYLISHATGARKLDPSFPRLEDVPTATEPLERLPRFPAPSRWTIGSFGMAYVLLFGPVNIWLLRRLRRTVRAWLLMPALSMILTGGVLTLGSAWGTTQVVFHTLSVLETVGGSGTAREQNLAALFSPTNRIFSLEIEDPAPALRFLSSESAPATSFPGAPAWHPRHAGAGPGITPGFRDGDLCRWERIGFTLWTIQRFATERAADLGGGVRLELDQRLSGRVVNATSQPLRRAYLQYPGWRCSLGDVAPGAVKAIAASGWQRRRPPAETTYTSTSRPTGGPARQSAPGIPGLEEADSGSDLFSIAGSLLLGSGAGSRAAREAEVVLVARVTGLMVPVRIPGVERTEVPETREGAILLVRQPIAGKVSFEPGSDEGEGRP
jgi:hypothetical protein